jgi:hypothetical protein
MNDLPEAPESKTIKSAFSTDNTASSGALFTPDELNIYVNKITLEAHIFHAKPVAQDIDRLEYDAADHSVTVIKKDGTRLDLGVKIEWLIRSYFTKAKEVGIVQTKNGEVVDGFNVPLVHKPQK